MFSESCAMPSPGCSRHISEMVENTLVTDRPFHKHLGKPHETETFAFAGGIYLHRVHCTTDRFRRRRAQHHHATAEPEPAGGNQRDLFRRGQRTSNLALSMVTQWNQSV